MDIFMCEVHFTATEDDVKVELAKILHKAPFPLQPVLNFEVTFFRRCDPRGKKGILTLPTESAGRTFLSSYGSTGLLIKGRRMFFSSSNRPLNDERVAILNSRPWRSPQQLREENEWRIRRGTHFMLRSYAFGRFLANGSFSSEFVAEGSADIACDLERHQVCFTLRKQGRRSNLDSNLATYMRNLLLDPFESTAVVPFESTTVVSYPTKAIDSIIESYGAREPILFIKANTFPFFAIETESLLFSDRVDSRRSQGLIPNVQMPPGCFNLACTFVDKRDKEAFIYATQSRFHLRHVSKQAPIRVRENTSAHHGTAGPDLSFLRDLPFQLAFEVEKAIANCTLSHTNASSLLERLNRLCDEHGDAAAPIFRRFISLLKDEGVNKQPRQNRAAPPTLGSRLDHAVELYLEEQSRPRGRLALALSGPAVSYSYHMILTPTRYILEGPIADHSNSVLRRFGHHECFLRVSFQDENGSKLRRDLGTSITDLLAKWYRPVLLKGCLVAGRRYEMLGYSMSGLKEHSLWFVTPFHDDQGRLLDAKKIRESLGNFSHLIYQPARLGARWSQAFSATDPSITLAPNEIVQIDDIKSPANKVMTDGCSPISTELSEAIWRANQQTKKHPARGKAPSAFQFRLGGAKGMVVQDPTLLGRVVCLRLSQVEFDARKNRTFDIQSTSLRPKAMFRNRPLIVLLEYLRSSNERIIELQDRSIDEAQSTRRSFEDASKVLQQHGMGMSFRLPSLFNNMSSLLSLRIYKKSEPDGLYNDLIANALYCAETHILRELKYRAHIAVPGSFTLLGVSDEWDCLAEGEIYATVHDEKTGLYKEITGTVAITRSPQMHPGACRL